MAGNRMQTPGGADGSPRCRGAIVPRGDPLRNNALHPLQRWRKVRDLPIVAPRALGWK
jgi:hypothetical protein